MAVVRQEQKSDEPCENMADTIDQRCLGKIFQFLKQREPALNKEQKIRE